MATRATNIYGAGVSGPVPVYSRALATELLQNLLVVR